MTENFLLWYKENGRHDLPWRLTKNPYKIYLSEIMLQQTTVSTVLNRFYSPFLTLFPTLKDVAQSPLDDVLKAWEGLGYYTRARNLYATAHQTLGILPSNSSDLEKLPGIGKSTAHAIACFAFGEHVPILDANVKRILSRLYDVHTPNTLWEKAWKSLPTDAYNHNQGLMDLGALICKKKPLCSLCPLQPQCLYAQGIHNAPFQLKKSIPHKETFIILHYIDNQFFVVRQTGKFLGGLRSFVQSSSPPEDFSPLGEISHTYSHFSLHAIVGVSHKYPLQEGEWVHNFTNIALSGIDKKALNLFYAIINKNKSGD